MDPVVNSQAEAEADADLEMARARRARSGKKVASIDEQHPDLTRGQRFMAQNLSTGPENAMAYLQKQGFETKLQGGNILIKKPGEKDYYRLDESGFSLSDLTDIGGDITSAIGAGAGAVGGTLAAGAMTLNPVAAFAGGVAGAAGGGGAAEWIKGKIGRLAGMPEKGESVEGAALREGAWSGSGEGVLRLAAPVVKGVFRGLSGSMEKEIAEEAITKQAQAAKTSKLGRSEGLRDTAEEIIARQGAAKGEGAEINRTLRAADDAGLAAKEAADKATVLKMQQRYAAELEARRAAAKQAAEETATQEGAEAGAKKASGVVEDTLPPDVPKAAEIASKLATKEKSTFRFLSELTHPAWGIKAQYLPRLPEFTAILNKHFPGIYRPEASAAMMTRDAHLDRLLTEITQGTADQKSEDFAMDIGKWMLSDERLQLTAAAREAASRLAAGAPARGDAGRAADAIFKSSNLPEYLESAIKQLKDTRVLVADSVAKKKALAESIAPRKEALARGKEALDQDISSLRMGRAKNSRANEAEQILINNAKNSEAARQNAYRGPMGSMLRLGNWAGEAPGALPLIGGASKHLLGPIAYGARHEAGKLAPAGRAVERAVDSVLPQAMRNQQFARKLGTQVFGTQLAESQF